MEQNTRPKRKAINKKTRFEIFKRDGFKCQYCGAHPPSVVLQVDHILAVANGGTNSTDNLITSCQPCNIGKGVSDLRVAPRSLEEKAAETKEREMQLAGYAEIMESARQRLADDTWRVLDHILGPVDSVPHDQFNSTKRFIEQIGVYEVLDAADIALASGVHYSRRFRYFCGICWNRIREIV